MIGIVVVTHGRLAEELLLAAEHVVGPLERARPVCIGPDDDLEQRRADVAAAVEAVARTRTQVVAGKAVDIVVVVGIAAERSWVRLELLEG